MTPPLKSSPGIKMRDGASRVSESRKLSATSLGAAPLTLLTVPASPIPSLLPWHTLEPVSRLTRDTSSPLLAGLPQGPAIEVAPNSHSPSDNSLCLSISAVIRAP
ncbi:hypothetical protein CLIM01_10433 [Colletotrichum limetticola]|uniref:Uncharacterized protein n=1 Tax=Colletotrichum limetticola TaxID=1209924 RepID=A0ABQ9PJI5_9PEZI|nr:hypothetical protein CLIM01_10433 [Colletotrichum limetticola]